MKDKNHSWEFRNSRGEAEVLVHPKTYACVFILMGLWILSSVFVNLFSHSEPVKGH